ncbi:hypothetical protein EMCRGX_G022723 [Ephydatia muelleri]
MNSSCQRWTTFATSSGIYIRGAPLISSPPEGSIKEKASEMPEDLSHLKKAVIYDCRYILPILTQCTRISAKNRSIRFDAGLICDESKGPSSEQQGHAVLSTCCCYPLNYALGAYQCTARELEWLCQKIGTQLTLELAQNRRAILACNRWTMIMREDWRRGNLPKIIYENIGCDPWLAASTNS